MTKPTVRESTRDVIRDVLFSLSEELDFPEMDADEPLTKGELQTLVVYLRRASDSLEGDEP